MRATFSQCTTQTGSLRLVFFSSPLLSRDTSTPIGRGTADCAQEENLVCRPLVLGSELSHKATDCSPVGAGQPSAHQHCRAAAQGCSALEPTCKGFVCYCPAWSMGNPNDSPE
uniref:Uncharacterized protein n=1 Tax=Eutreptiella gymnastica TaxID=73025 RepID=A0A7S1N3T1_9EUGL